LFYGALDAPGIPLQNSSLSSLAHSQMESREFFERKRTAIILHRDAGKSHGRDTVNALNMSEVNFNFVRKPFGGFKETGFVKLRYVPGSPRSKWASERLYRVPYRIRRRRISRHVVRMGVKMAAKKCLADALASVVKPHQP